MSEAPDASASLSELIIVVRGAVRNAYAVRRPAALRTRSTIPGGQQRNTGFLLGRPAAAHAAAFALRSIAQMRLAQIRLCRRQASTVSSPAASDRQSPFPFCELPSLG